MAPSPRRPAAERGAGSAVAGASPKPRRPRKTAAAAATKQATTEQAGTEPQQEAEQDPRAPAAVAPPRSGPRWLQPGGEPPRWEPRSDDEPQPSRLAARSAGAGWVLPERAARPDADAGSPPPAPAPVAAPAAGQWQPESQEPTEAPTGSWPFPAPQPLAAPTPEPGASIFPPARPSTADAPAVPFPWVEAAMHPATVVAAVPATVPAPRRGRRGQLLSADMGAAAALAINVGLVAVMLGSFLTGISAHSFLGSSLVSEFDRGFRYRLLAVFSQASFDQAVFIVVAIMLTVAVPAERPSTLRRAALYCSSALGVFVAFGALLRAVALITFLGTAAALAVGSTVSALAAIPVAAAATAWAVVLLTRRSDETG